MDLRAPLPSCRSRRSTAAFGALSCCSCATCKALVTEAELKLFRASDAKVKAIRDRRSPRTLRERDEAVETAQAQVLAAQTARDLAQGEYDYAYGQLEMTGLLCWNMYEESATSAPAPAPDTHQGHDTYGGSSDQGGSSYGGAYQGDYQHYQDGTYDA